MTEFCQISEYPLRCSSTSCKILPVMDSDAYCRRCDCRLLPQVDMPAKKWRVCDACLDFIRQHPGCVHPKSSPLNDPPDKPAKRPRTPRPTRRTAK